MLYVDITTAEDCIMQSLPILLVNFCLALENISKVLEDLAHRRQLRILSMEILNCLQPAGDATVV